MERKNVNEWAEWHGGEMPVPKGTPVEVRHRDGREYRELAGARYAEHWDLRGVVSDIVAYRVVPEPKHAPEFHVKSLRTDEVLKVCKTLKKALKLMEIIHRAGGEAYIKEVAL